MMLRPISAESPRQARPRLEVLEDRTAPAVFLVNSLADGPPTADDQLTLREAITAATTNASSGDAPAGETNPDTIVFAGNLQGGTLFLTQGELELTGGGELSIVGPGGVKGGILLNGNNASRIFNVSSSEAVRLANLTLTRGNSGAGDGGALIHSGADLTVLNARITNNTAGDDGGGIDNGGTLTLTDVEVSNNSAETNGGGVFNNNGRLTIEGGSRLVSNSTLTGEGGGLHTEGGGGPVLVRDTTVAGNFSPASGGGINVVDTNTEIIGGTLSGNRALGEGGGLSVRTNVVVNIINSTVAENLSDANGGGIGVADGMVTITQATIVGNAATAAGGGIDQDGGTLTVNNSVLARNLAAVAGTDERRAGGGTFTGESNREGGNPRLSPLQDNGGPTFTMVPLAGSSLVGAGNNSLAVDPGGNPLTTDQRGFPRRVGTNVDQGAVEFFAPATVTTLVAVQNGVPVTGTSTALRIDLVASVTASTSSVVPSGEVIFFDDRTPTDPTDVPTQLNTIPIPLNAEGEGSLPNVALSPGGHNLTVRFIPSGGFSSSASRFLAVTARRIDTVGVFDPASVAFQLLNNNQNSPAGPDFGYPFGFTSASPVVGNWTGASSGVALPGQVNVFDGQLRWELSDENPPVLPNLTPFFFGLDGQVPLAGDWDGDGETGIGVYDPATGAFLLRNEPDNGFPDFSFNFGAPGQLPVVGNWDGMGGDEVGVYNPANGQWTLAANNPPTGAAGVFTQFLFGGQAGAVPVAGDWDGDGTDGIGVYFPQPSGFGGFLLRNSPSAGGADVNSGEVILAGLSTWLPLAGNWGPAPLSSNDLLALRAANGNGPGASALGHGTLQATVAEALAHLAEAGARAELLHALADADYVLGDLPGTLLAAADVAGGRVVVDVDAAGWGWSARESEEGAGMDLVTALLHEMGHLAGLPHGTGLMTETLAPGSRTLDALDTLFADTVPLWGSPGEGKEAVAV